MSILKNKLKREFTLTPNALLTDNRLSMGAKVVYIYLASKPDGWKVWNQEIQNSLNIKDSGTIAKYWKELLDSGWLKRERIKDEDGKFSGGYDYELIDTPNMDDNHIGEKPTNGQTPSHSNTDTNNNTNISNNIDNNISANGKLFETETKIKKPKQNGYIEIIQDISKNQKVRDALLEYCNFRRSRGLTHQQWKTIVLEFKQNSEGKSVDQVLECIKQCIMNGRNTLYYADYSKTQTYTTKQNVEECNQLKRSDNF